MESGTLENRWAGEPWIATALYASILLTHVVRLDQPIWEGYIGRQVPTAMVARNLARTGDFLHPTLDTGPFPSYFLVEPPIYAGAAALVRLGTGLPLEAAGRLVSALGTTVAAWGLFGPARRRGGFEVAAVSVALFGFFPVMLRYGRAFQPDALMLGLTLAGLRCLDSERPPARFLGWWLLAVGLAAKVTGAFFLAVVPLLRTDERRSRPRRAAFALSPLLFAAAWYAWTAWLMRSGSAGVSASSGNAANWMSRLANVFAWDVVSILRDWLWRAFSPAGFVLFAAGLVRFHGLDRLWRRLAFATLAALVVLAGKLHHGYYEMLAAPVVAVITATGLSWSVRNRRMLGWAIPGVFVILALVQVRSTWSTPTEWRGLSEAGERIRSVVPPNKVLIAPEALVYAADRKGCRLETEPAGVRRAADEWGGTAGTATELVDLYRAKADAEFFADLRSGSDRAAIHEALRRRPDASILIDRPGGLLLIRFGAEGSANAGSP